MNNYINKFSLLYIEHRNYTSVGSYLISFPQANRVDPDEAALLQKRLNKAKAYYSIF